MYKIIKNENTINKIKKVSFKECGYKERDNLQEWIAKNPECLGEELLIIQKEFAGFSDTYERLDLLALDKNKDLVIIENKLDDTGRDVTWQALKYASYCSTLNTQEIIDIYQSYLDKYEPNSSAKENLVDFLFDSEDESRLEEVQFNKNSQRIIFIAANFRKEVTSTVMWLLNNGIRIQCFSTQIFQYDNEQIFDIKQIIPVKEVEDYIIKLANKEKDESTRVISSNQTKEIRKKFWHQLLTEYNKISDDYKTINPTDDHWLNTSSGNSGIYFSLVATQKYAGVEITINAGEKELNKLIFDTLLKEKNIIEDGIGHELVWERLDNRKGCRVSFRKEGLNGMNESDWSEIIRFMCSEMPKFISTIKPIINNVCSEIITRKK